MKVGKGPKSYHLVGGFPGELRGFDAVNNYFAPGFPNFLEMAASVKEAW